MGTRYVLRIRGQRGFHRGNQVRLPLDKINRVDFPFPHALAAQIAAGLDDLPLFANQPIAQSEADPLAEAIGGIDPDSLTPREALEALYALKRLAAEG